MESSGSGASPECGAGSIVWVRRRNGSWWPGKILGPEELPASHLTSPRTGTPVKLLGREDASVDWYNLEKSKRVKAFRCGEFDDCIERAESSHGMPPKKREKYARREDAILHALELEKELLRKQVKLDSTPDHGSSKSSGSMKLDTGDSDISNGKLGNSKSKQFLMRQETSNKGEILSSPLDYEKQKEGNQCTSENDHAEFIPRMKELQDLGLKTASAKENYMLSGALDDRTSKPTAVDAQAIYGRGPTMGRPRDINGEEHIEGVSRAKRSRFMYLPSQTSDALKYKEIHPNRIEMSAFQIEESDSYPFAGQLVEDNAREFLEVGDSGLSESTSSELASESDSSQTEADIDEDMVSLSAVPRKVKLNVPGRAESLDDGGSENIDESDESSLSGDTPHLYRPDPHSSNGAVSKWRLKGKRNMRNLVQTSSNAGFRGFRGPTFRQRTSGQYSYRNDYVDNDDDEDYDDDDDDDNDDDEDEEQDDNDDDDDDDDDVVTGFTAKGSRRDMVRFGNGGYVQALRASIDRSGFNHNMINWENRAALNQHWKDRAGHFDPAYVGRQHYGGRMRSSLIDVDIKVQASFQKGAVPIVSLMSKLDGKAIIGHPIQIETLEDGSSEMLVPTNGFLHNQEGSSSSLPSAWRTAKRTNFRVPRPHLSTLGGDEGIEDHSFLNQERQASLKKRNVGSLAGIGRKSNSHLGKFPRKLPKRVSLSSSSSFSQKIRSLSSIGARPSAHDSMKSQLVGLIKPAESTTTTVACIPVKLVFSRLLEKINRPPSKAVAAIRDS